jgi:hypothetical protein
MSNNYKYICINSTDRISGSPANYKIQLNESIEANYLELYKVQIGNTFYNITSKNNQIAIDTGGDNPLIYTITQGNYNLNEFLDQLVTDVTEINNITYNDVSGVLTITLSGNYNLFFPNGSLMYLILGFPKDYNTQATTHNSINPPSIFDLEIFLNISGCHGSYSSSGNNNTGTFIVPNNVNKNSMISYYAHSQYCQRVKYNKKNNHVLTINWTDQYGDDLIKCSEHTIL